MKNQRLEKALHTRFLPHPRMVSFGDRACILRDGISVELVTASADDAYAGEASSLFQRYWHIVPSITTRQDSSLMNRDPEEYEVNVTESSICLVSRDFTGIDYALKTLRQQAEAERGLSAVRNYVLQPMIVKDSPALKFRGIHLCIFPETDMWQVEKRLRVAAELKMNYAVIESWGVFPFRSHPEFGWADQKKELSEFQRLVDTAKECHIRLIPQFNVFGHASMARVSSAKHAILDLHRALEPIFEPFGWSFCLSNPETRKILTDLVLELYEFYGKPEYFHIGCDESYDFQTCRACTEFDPARLLNDHITYFRDLFKAQGTRIIMWHDMLFTREDPAVKDCIACGNEDTIPLLNLLPRDIIMADWQYGKPPESAPDHEWATTKILREKGFDVLVCPWLEESGMFKLAEMAEKYHLAGMLETTWHMADNRWFTSEFFTGSHCMWNGGKKNEYDRSERLALTAAVRRAGYDMHLCAYEQSGDSKLQIVREGYPS